ncbi:gliding motility protein RemB [Pedobacter sp. KR3-3]|uniref:Gliding motility protein RemB n=1 Tax=Pedobacter albus TaxID=3113905 RepID=A0ABU7IC36_9SPHI|nr:gliding motility protein RemB [Pedobacter sp. KR3-3]MEE1946856.1 gliding motility protein RemB [Pedobacter sp. KR3-3]
MKRNLFSLLLTLAGLSASAQQIIPYSYSQYQKLNKSLYSKDTRFHTSLRPTIGDDTTIVRQLDSLSMIGTDRVRNPWATRKLFNEHLVEINKEDFSVYLDFLPDFQIGRDTEHKITTWLNTRGYQVGGTIGKKFSFYTSGFENQSRFNNYLTNYINSIGVIPGMVNDKFGANKNTKDWAYATAVVNFTPNKFFSFTLGHDKNFVGDGYRSMLLSDVSASYPFFKIVTTLGNVKYMTMWAQFQDPLSQQFSYDNGFRKKWGAFHYLDWNVNNRLSLGFFDSIIWQDADATGKRGFDVSYLNPVIFLRTVEGMNGSPDNALIGFTGKYKLLNNLTVYGQWAIDEFTAKEVFSNKGYWGNKFAYQLGVKGFDAFKVAGLNYLAEFNMARPFTYSQRTSLLNYGNYAEALAHPMGANFREVLTIWNYQYNKWAFSAQANYARYGLDNGQNVGKDINEPYDTRTGQYGYKTGGGLKTNFMYLDGRVSYVLNPKYNLRLELGGIYRQEKNSLSNDKTTMVTFGLRSTFRNIYQDF